MPRLAVLLAVVIPGLAACGDDAPGGVDLGGVDGLERRSCRTTLVFKPGPAVSGVAVGGEWNGFRAAETPMTGPDASGAYRAELELSKGVYAYKLVVTENGTPSWRLDPDNPYSKFLDGNEHSALEIEDCEQPLVRFERLERSAAGAFSAEVRYVDGARGAGLGALSATLDGAPLPAVTDGSGRVALVASGLARDKHRLVVRATDAAGRAARDLHVPFWIEDKPFDFRDGLLYFAFTDRFRNGDPSNDAPASGVDARANYDGGDFAGVREKIEDGYFDALGVRTLWISPPNANPGGAYPGSDGRQYTGYHGYWPSAGRDPQARFGTLAELRALVQAAHRHGMRVIIDSVLNHVHRDHPLYAAHKTDGWFNGDGSCVCGQGSCDWDAHRLDCWFTDYLPDVNYQSWDATDAMIEDALFWAREVDVDGFRVDAVKHFEHAATRRLRGRLRAELEHAGALYYLVGETFTGGDDGGRQYIKTFLGPNELHAQFDFPIYWSALGALGTYAVTMRALEGASNATDATFGEAPMSPFFGNHDVPRFLTQAALMLVGDGKEQAWTNPPGAPSDSAGYIKLRLALTFLGTQPGVPLLYYGDEIGLPGAQDPDNRRRMKWDGHTADEAETLAHARRVGEARRQLRALRRGKRRTAWVDDDLYVYARHLPASGTAPAEVAIVVLNRAWNARNESVPVPADVTLPDGTVLLDRLGGPGVTVTDGKIPVAIGPHQSAILAPEMRLHPSSVIAAVLCLLATRAAAAPAPMASFFELPTGNGHGFAVFDVAQHKLVQLLERPYRYLSPGSDPRGEGVYRRDLAHDLYFGVRTGGVGAWLPERAQEEVGYVEQSGVVRSVASLGEVRVESFFFMPFGLERNALVMVARATNTGASAATVDLFALPNLRLGGGSGDQPSAANETITTTGARSVETGALGEAGGALVYLPLGAVARAHCGDGGYDAVKAGSALPGDTRSCSGDDRTLIFQSAPLTLGPGDHASFGLVIGFATTVSGAGALGDDLAAFLSDRGADQVLADVLEEWETWRKPPPAGLSDDERRVYRQSEAVLRMAQVREPWLAQPKQKGHGMILASLPPGIWHIGWVRDATYALVALVRMGHLAEARDALRFFLAAEAGGYASYAGGPYRVSVTRYFGDGQEEADWNDKGPNVEFDGWGLYLWALRQYVDAGGPALLDEALATGEKTLDVVRSGVGEPLLRNVEPGGLVRPDTSIWESHWDLRKHYAYTSLAAARGLCDLASIEERHGDPARAAIARGQAAQIRAAIRANLLDRNLVLGGSREGLAGGTYHDGAVLEAFNWELFDPDAALYPATLAALEKVLRLPSGGWKRNDDALSKYDSNEWTFIDLRAANAFRARGQTARADELVSWVTAQARVNFDLVAELYNAFPEDGPLWSYAGATPMVGFGAGAYVLALRARAGEPEAHDCADPGRDGGVTDGDLGDDAGGCGCTLGRARVSCGAMAIAAIGLVLLALFAHRRRRA